MADIPYDEAYWRRRAEAARHLADFASSLVSRTVMYGVAADCEAMAKLVAMHRGSEPGGRVALPHRSTPLAGGIPEARPFLQLLSELEELRRTGGISLVHGKIPRRRR